MIHSALPTLLAFPTPSLLNTHLNVCQRAEANSSTYDDVNVPQHLVRTFMGQGFCWWSLQVPNRQHQQYCYTQLVVARVGASATHPFAMWGFQFFLPRHTLRISPDISVVVLLVKGMYYLLLPTLFQKCDVTTTFDVHLVAPRTEYTNFVFERIVRMTPPPFFKKRSMMTDSYSEVWRRQCRRAQKVEGLVFRLLAIRSIMNEGWFCEVAAFPANLLLPQPK